ncbi:MAG: transposase [Bacteroidetes bacterium]|nr:transposase [Bacteroidota bacterium]
MHYCACKNFTANVYESILEIDNNLVENAIRLTVIGRKNCLFSGSHYGTINSAMMYAFFG